jgi:hypothetical protein
VLHEEKTAMETTWRKIMNKSTSLGMWSRKACNNNIIALMQSVSKRSLIKALPLYEKTTSSMYSVGVQ